MKRRLVPLVLLLLLLSGCGADTPGQSARSAPAEESAAPQSDPPQEAAPQHQAAAEGPQSTAPESEAAEESRAGAAASEADEAFSLVLFSAEDLPLMPADYSAFDSDSVAGYARILLESGGAGLDPEMGRWEAHYQSADEEWEQGSSAFYITKSYINSPFYQHPAAVQSMVRMRSERNEWTGLSTALYRLELDIPPGTGLPSGTGTWYLKTVIRPYQDILLVDWLMPEQEYLQWMDAQSQEADCHRVREFLLGSMYLDRDDPWFDSPADIAPQNRGVYLLITQELEDRWVFGWATQEQMDAWSQRVFGQAPFRPAEGERTLRAEDMYGLSDGGGYPYIHSYVGRRVAQGDLWVYEHFWYRSDGDYNFRGFVQQPAGVIRLGLREDMVYLYQAEVFGGGEE